MEGLVTYGDILRVIGQMLDAEAGQVADIIVQDRFITVTWQTTPGVTAQRSFRDLDLAGLQQQAQLLRETAQDPLHTHAELLRTLGQEIDDQGIALSAIFEEDEGCRVSGTARRADINVLYTWDDLRRSSLQRRALRRDTPGPGAREALEDAPPLRVARTWWTFWRRRWTPLRSTP